MDLISQEQYYNELEKLIAEYKNSANANEQEMYQYEEEIYKGRKKLAEDLAKAQANALKKSLQDQKDALEQQKSDMEAAVGYVIGQFQEEIDVLEEQKDAINKRYDAELDSLEKQNEELESQIELQKALDQLERAKQSQVMVFKDGKMQYTSDPDAVSSAQANLNETKRQDELRRKKDAIERNRQLELSAIDYQIDYLNRQKKNWEDIIDNYKDSQDRLIAEQVFGINFEKAGWEQRIGNAEDFAEKYEEVANHIMDVAIQLQQAIDAVNAAVADAKSISVPSVASVRSANANMARPSSLMKSTSGISPMSRSVGINIENFNPNLSNVTDGEGFANYMKNNFWRETMQMANV